MISNENTTILSVVPAMFGVEEWYPPEYRQLRKMLPITSAKQDGTSSESRSDPASSRFSEGGELIVLCGFKDFFNVVRTWPL